MSKPILTIRDYMTAMPHSIEPHQNLKDAKKKMTELAVRHLPVLAAKNVVGILTDRDIDLLATFKGVDLHKATVSDAMLPNPYCVEPTTDVAQVSTYMAENRIGSALVVQSNRLVGIFTYVDALRCLAEVLTTRA